MDTGKTVIKYRKTSNQNLRVIYSNTRILREISKLRWPMSSLDVKLRYWEVMWLVWHTLWIQYFEVSAHPINTFHQYTLSKSESSSKWDLVHDIYLLHLIIFSLFSFLVSCMYSFIHSLSHSLCSCAQKRPLKRISQERHLYVLLFETTVVPSPT